MTIVTHADAKPARKRAPSTGVDGVVERIAALEARVEELERCKHDSHTIAPEAIKHIVEAVKQDIVKTLLAVLPADEENKP